MKVLHSLADYEPKILLAFGESLKGDRKFTDFLMTNQFQELAALSGAINSDTDALNWLLQSDFPEFGVLSNAIDGEDNALEWLKKYNCDFLLKFALACQKNDQAIKWFVDNDLRIFILLIRTIHDILLHQSWDSSDIHKIRRS
ncbi:MAG: hypothetical protein GX587_16175 [Bacteroidales bacterium]|jgi:hypothetical protein|nr:hypothetical protein [Bacteroidales bacterium]NLF44230.1 hypothetical protein [Bacteroidales bacterium]